MGDDVSVIIHDDELSYFHNVGDLPLFTGTRSSVREAGVLAAQMLLDLIDRKVAGPINRLLESRLTIGMFDRTAAQAALNRSSRRSASSERYSQVPTSIL